MRSTNIQLAKSPRPILSQSFDKLGLQRRSFALNAVLERAALYAYGEAEANSKDSVVFRIHHLFESMLNASAEEQTRFLPTVRACGMKLSDFSFKGDRGRDEAAALQLPGSPGHENWITPDHDTRRILRLAKTLAAQSGEPAIDTMHVFRAMVEDKKHQGSQSVNAWLDSANVTDSVLIATSRRLNTWQCSLDALPMTQLGHAGIERGFPPVAVNVGAVKADTAHLANQRRLGIIGGGFTPKLELFTPLGMDISRWFILTQCFQFCVGFALILGLIEIIRSGHPWWGIFGLILAVWNVPSMHWSVIWFIRLVSMAILFLSGLYPWLGLVALTAMYFPLQTWLTLLIQRRETRDPGYDQRQMDEDKVWAALGSFTTKSQ